ncbi:ty3-gypsy retrotransposon protein [Cucumis melo var. makuwa]|uniref:Ty3-gypsy retrotransposon protein n=1 Tax=Cucumis melo var. makuwa TaxID=1194695 RepID=A0A5D3B926_CUCMM|nr:ty3-gypsy retrotransposon protein [Cucumis melo var. makuwa]TYJ96362.1 ty3-gypsy retrotransposon protein [Cucumis melo var. makuwa]
MPDGLPLMRQIDHRIQLKEGMDPINVRPYCYPYVQKNEIERLVNDMLALGIIRPSTSPFFSPAILVKKKDGGWRFCVDHRTLNRATVLDKFPIPMIDELNGANVETHLEHLTVVFQLLRQHCLFANRKKCHFAKDRIKYLGHWVLAKGVEADQEKIKAMLEWPIPKNVRELWGFLGLTGYYRWFVAKYGTIATPLTRLTKKNNFRWSEEATKTFEQLKRCYRKTRGQSYFSQKLLKTAREKSVYERELMAIVLAVEKWRHYLLAGPENKAVDALSRIPIEAELDVITVPSLLDIIVIEREVQEDEKLKLRTYKKIAAELFWEGMKNDIKLYVDQCHVCQQNKVQALSPVGLLQPLPIPNRIWEDISMDFVEGLPRSKGFDTIFVVVDRLSKYAHFITLSHPFSAKIVAMVFIKEPPSPIILYGQIGTTLNDSVEHQLQSRDEMLAVLKRHLQHAQERMKKFVDVHRRDMVFDIGDRSLPAGPSVTAKIHPVFHVSQLKKAVGDKHQVYADIALINDQMELVLEPENVTQLRWNEAERDWEYLVQWKDQPSHEATWEFYAVLRHQFPNFHLEDKVVLLHGVLLGLQSIKFTREGVKRGIPPRQHGS